MESHRALPSRGPAPSPGARTSDSLADILERVLDKGIVIAGDIQINLLDIELLTIKLRLLVASVDRAQGDGHQLVGERPGAHPRRREELERENHELRDRLERLEQRLGSSEAARRSARSARTRSQDRALWAYCVTTPARAGSVRRGWPSTAHPGRAGGGRRARRLRVGGAARRVRRGAAAREPQRPPMARAGRACHEAVLEAARRGHGRAAAGCARSSPIAAVSRACSRTSTTRSPPPPPRSPAARSGR